MVKITEQLIRKKSEHNELIISTLEELSLHQENIDEIDHVQDWCRDLKILLLQSNLISKIEKLGKLKKLEYLHLAVNNIEKVENLEGLESLSKLDLTLNFIGDIESIASLKDNHNLKELMMTGNPCTDYPHYRTFVIHTLPQLKFLDSTPITKSEQLAAKLAFPNILPEIKQSQEDYRIYRQEQKVRVKLQIEENQRRMEEITDEAERNKFFWDLKGEHCPESRVEIATKQMESERRKNLSTDVKEKKRPRRLFTESGTPLNFNEAKLDFLFRDLRSSLELELFIPKFCDTDLLSVDLETNYVRVTMKEKIFQLALQEEIRIHDSSSQRSQTTGHLVIKMPKMNYTEDVQVTKKELKDHASSRNDIEYKVKVGAAAGDLSEIPDLV